MPIGPGLSTPSRNARAIAIRVPVNARGEVSLDQLARDGDRDSAVGADEPWGLNPGWIVFTTLFVRGSMRETVPAT
jgi:hypothetical protein